MRAQRRDGDWPYGVGQLGHELRALQITLRGTGDIVEAHHFEGSSSAVLEWRLASITFDRALTTA